MIILKLISQLCYLRQPIQLNIQTAMVIGALPFSLVMALMGIALIKGILRDAQREKNGVASVHSEG